MLMVKENIICECTLEDTGTQIVEVQKTIGFIKPANYTPNEWEQIELVEIEGVNYEMVSPKPLEVL